MGQTRPKLGPRLGSHVYEPAGPVTIINPVKWCACGEPIRPIFEQCHTCFTALDAESKTKTQRKLWKERYTRKPYNPDRGERSLGRTQ